MKIEILGAAAPVESSQPGLPLCLSPVEGGFLSPAEDYLDKRLNLQTHLVTHESATFFVVSRYFRDQKLTACQYDERLESAKTS